MATEEQKKARVIRLFNMLIFGLGKGLYDLFGDAAIGIVGPIGEEILEEMEQELGLEIHGEDPQTILTEIERILIDEYGLVKDARIEIHPETHSASPSITKKGRWISTSTCLMKIKKMIPKVFCVGGQTTRTDRIYNLNRLCNAL